MCPKKDYKISIWPFVSNEAAKRNSKNKPKEIIVTVYGL